MSQDKHYFACLVSLQLTHFISIHFSKQSRCHCHAVTMATGNATCVLAVKRIRVMELQRDENEQ